jgi:hypothetical protein
VKFVLEQSRSRQAADSIKLLELDALDSRFHTELVSSPHKKLIRHLRYGQTRSQGVHFFSLGASWFRQGSLKAWLRAEVGWPR